MQTNVGKLELGHPTLTEIPRDETLEADGSISVYEIGTMEVVAQYEGLEVHDLVLACKEMCDSRGIEIGDFIIVGSEPYYEMIYALASIDPGWASKKVLNHDKR